MVEARKEKKDLGLLRTVAEESEGSLEAMLSPETLAGIVNSLVDGLPLSHAASLLSPSGDSEIARTKVLDIIVGYGTWLSRTHKSAPGRPFVFAPEYSQLQLFAASPSKKRRSPRGALVIPRGYEALAGPRRGGRNGLNSILTLLHYRPGPDDASRYLHIERRRRERALSFDMLSAVWGFAARERLDDMVGLGGDPRFLRLAVEAYDLLDTYRQDAVRSLVRLIGPEPAGPDEIAELVTRCVWLAEGPLSRVVKAAGMTDPRALKAELSSLSQRVRAGAVPIPACVGDMTAGQIKRIGQLAGLLDENSSFQEEREIRSRLRSMGFGKDAERLSADGLAAAKAGNLDMFWEAMEARADGDLTWSDIMSEAVSG